MNVIRLECDFMKNKVMITMIRGNGNCYGFTYILSKEDADFVEREIKGLY